jgi:hypothetical protein
MAKMPSKARKTTSKAARVVGLLAGLLTYALVPLTGRAAIGVAALVAAAAGYGAVLLAVGWAFRRINGMGKGR